MKQLNSIDFTQNSLNNAEFQLLAAASSTPVKGQFYMSTVTNTLHYYTGTVDYDSGFAAHSISELLAPTAALAMGNNKITGLGLGVAQTDAANIQNITNAMDVLTGGMLYKTYVRTVFTSNQTLNAIAALNDTVTLAIGDRFLLVGQTTASQNGPYLWQGASTTAIRAGDSSSTNNYELEEASSWIVAEGASGANQIWRISTTGVISANTTSVTIANISTAGTVYTQGANVTISGTVISVANGTFTKKYVSALGTSALSTTVADGLGTIYKTYSLQDPSGNIVGADVQLSSTGATVTFGSIPSIVYTITLIG